MGEIENAILLCLYFLPFGITQQQISHLWKIGMFEVSIYLRQLKTDGLIEIHSTSISPIFYLTKKGEDYTKYLSKETQNESDGLQLERQSLSLL